MLGMKISDFNVQASTVYLMGKGSKPRLVPVSKEVVKLFEGYRKKLHADSIGCEPMFYTIHKGEKTFMSDDNVARFIKKYAEYVRESNVEIPEHVHPHMFRRSRSMHLYRSGMPLALLAGFLGHENPETTLIYSFADTEMKRAAIEKASEKNVRLEGIGESAIWEGDDDIIGRLCRGY
jgi:site-specific recombinase XerD